MSENSDTLVKERVISGSIKAPEIVVKNVLTLPQNSILLDLGAGEGRLANSISTLRPDIKIICLDYDLALNKKTLEVHPDANPINADANNLPFEEISMDMVVAINTFHEVCSASEYNDRLSQFRMIMLEINRVLKDGGEVIVFDGVDTTKDNPNVIITPKNEEARKKLLKYQTDYLAEKVEFEPTALENAPTISSYRTSLRDAILLQTKYSYIDNPNVWEGERRQLYPLLKQEDFESIMQPFFTDLEISYPQGRIGVVKFLEEFDISIQSGDSPTPLDEKTFPQTQIFIHAKK